ncbi:MAG: FxSxx-COOH system tetratricopeptide repeat protein [Thermodesulfobacteriota bacterium]
MPEADRKDFFISYNKADKAWAEWIAWELEDKGHTCVLQAWDFRAGGNFIAEMDQALRVAQRTIAVFSPDYFSSQYCQDEWTAAFKKRTLLPILVRQCNIEGLLGPMIYVDLVGVQDTDAARERLFVEIEQRRAKPSSAPRFPGARAAQEAPRFPGALPPIWNLLHRRNPNFTGREQLLEDIRASLAGSGAAPLTALCGLGGVGKTQLALEYAYRFALDYDLVWWVRAEDPLALAGDYAGLAVPLALPEAAAAEQEVQVTAVCQALGRRQKWLLIFDNAAEPQDLQGYVPQGGAGHVLITSRNPVWRGVAKPLDIKVWERPDAVAFLLQRTGQQDDAAAAELAAELGDLPLALEQAGAYMEESGCALAHYLDLFRTRRREILKRGQPSQDYPDTVATTWELSFQQVKAASPAAVDLLNLCAFLAPDDIPKQLLEQGAEHLPEPLAAAVQDPLALDDALGVLRRYSLLEVAGDALAVHRLVQAVARDRLEDDARKQWAGVAVALVNAAFPYIELENWPWCARLLPQALAALEHAAGLNLVISEMGRLWNQAGFYLQIRAEFAGARVAFERALTIDEAAYGPEHPEVAIRVNNLGNVLQALGDLAGARAYYERALAIDEATYGPDHPEVAIRVNNLGSVLQALGDLAGAKSAHERALAIDEAAYGPHHPNVAIGVNNLGLVLRALGDLAGAKAYFEQALAIDEAAYGPEHPKVAIRVNNLGNVLQALGDLAGAKGAYERALAIDEATYGPDHPEVAIDVNNLGSVLQDLGDLAGAKRAYERALAIDEAAYGPHHPNVAIRVNNLGNVLQDLGDLAGAKSAYERALALAEAAYGPNHPDVAGDVNNLGSVLRALGDLAGARSYYERALALWEQVYGLNHPQVATAVNNLGLVLHALGDLAGARSYYERALAIDEAAYGPNHPMVAIAVNNLGSVLQDLGDLAGARAYYERALALAEAAYGPEHPKVAIRVNNLGSVLRDLGDLAGAKAAYERALALCRRFLGEDHPNTQIVRDNLAALGD